MFCTKGELESYRAFTKMGCQFHFQGSYMIRISRRFYDKTVKARREQYLITKTVSMFKAQKIVKILQDGKEG